ncbi:hypothetical protein GLOIN_2v1470224 [Rhizophagus irregularis DAOM 181602=DAOM 197198]|uniref:Uncharacterized protein n=1 Tax=Rhizophagus irregularis (strain DAOM 181602 / DAOM 197198 / MUCL 43194) TaxID=747089 RepID=A0A2P4QXB3_RHIID|nr:hypothetical protein GLOIN_2v1470224 [Rhizophagus irregularis DAOM 181602=DAOM 197198]POG82269.1 hypothetical protein GLOIN_2v1470224 [Rhizophagus irregularis DAOM 181602=DAOM 197198]|eukprot:XP_025189135.1 hypothetical protein GLOIN_2v1470224 [Rhizophagus irregularis DAOM 181602=DAOM 197198]
MEKILRLSQQFYRRKLDKERFTSIHIHQKYNVPNQGRDKGLIAHNVYLINVKVTNTKIKKSNNTKSIPIKRKQNVRASSSKKKAKKAISIISDNSEDEDKCHNDNDNNKENNASKSFSKFDELEYQERNLALKERELDLREREAKLISARFVSFFSYFKAVPILLYRIGVRAFIEVAQKVFSLL